jgi:hypothetical protein
VVGPGGSQATDDEIAAGQFRVVTPADGTWWVYLTMAATDVAVS